MSGTFSGVFAGDRFQGRYSGKDGQIIYRDGDRQLGIYWEFGVSGIIIHAIPCKWKLPPGEPLTEEQQLEIFESLKAWLQAKGVPNRLGDEPWMTASDEVGVKCAWSRCLNPRVVGYAICRSHIKENYLEAILQRESRPQSEVASINR